MTAKSTLKTKKGEISEIEMKNILSHVMLFQHENNENS